MHPLGLDPRFTHEDGRSAAEPWNLLPATPAPERLLTRGPTQTWWREIRRTGHGAFTPGGDLDTVLQVPPADIAISGGVDAATLYCRCPSIGTAFLLVDGATSPEERQRAGLLGPVVEVLCTPHPDDFVATVLAMGTLVYNARAVSFHQFWRQLSGRRVLTGVGADEVFSGRHHALRDGSWPLHAQARSLRVEIVAPFTWPSVVSAVAALPESDRRNKAILRNDPRIPGAIATAHKHAVYAPPAGWLRLYRALACRPSPGIDTRRVLQLLDRWAGATEQERVLLDATLMRLASWAVLCGHRG